jgi:exodeoxyribonuclease VII small subunit
MESETPPPVSFEAALTQLQQVVSELEDGSLGLEPSLARFEQGVQLLRNCYQILEQAEQKIELLTGFDAQGNPVSAPFDAAATFDAADPATSGTPRRRGSRTASRQAAGSAERSDEPGGDSEESKSSLF